MPSNWKNWKREEYHPNFANRARWRKRHVKYTCEQCSAKQGDTQLSKSGQPYKVVVSAAHVNHDPQKAKAKLIILCQSCHLKYDGPMHGEKAVRTKRRNAVNAMRDAGQLELPLKFKKEKKQKRS